MLLFALDVLAEVGADDIDAAGAPTRRTARPAATNGNRI